MFGWMPEGIGWVRGKLGKAGNRDYGTETSLALREENCGNETFAAWGTSIQWMALCDSPFASEFQSRSPNPKRVM
jgi:hypothetical protein